MEEFLCHKSQPKTAYETNMIKNNEAQKRFTRRKTKLYCDYSRARHFSRP